MKNKTLGILIIVSLSLLIFTALFESVLVPADANLLYTVGGLGMYIFGIWGAVRLIKK